MKNQQYIYWTIVTFLLIISAAAFAFQYLFKAKNNLNNNNIITLNCNELYQLYNESFYKIINEKVYLIKNCTIKNITIPAGYRIIYIYNGSINYI